MIMIMMSILVTIVLMITKELYNTFIPNSFEQQKKRNFTCIPNM